METAFVEQIGEEQKHSSPNLEADHPLPPRMRGVSLPLLPEKPAAGKQRQPEFFTGAI